jgi:hypothetical protein
MALIQQQTMEFPFRTDDGGVVIDAPRRLLAALRRSAVSTDQPKGLVLLSGPSSVYRLGSVRQSIAHWPASRSCIWLGPMSSTPSW